MLGLLQEIAKVAQFIYQKAELAKANKQQCQRLVMRVKIVLAAIEGLGAHPSPQQYRESLDMLQNCLNDCLQFISQFSETNNWFKAVLKAGAHDAQFAAFNKNLGEIIVVLNLGVDTQHFLTNADDAKALHADLNQIQAMQQEIIDLQTKANQGIEGILLKQEEQHQLMQAQLLSMRNQLKQLVLPSQKPEIDPQLLINFFDLAFKAKISSGDVEELYLAQWQGAAVVVKRLKMLTPNTRQGFIRELQILSRLRHLNIVSMYGVSLQAGNESLVMEYLEQGSLAQRIRQSALPPGLQHKIALDIANGLLYLHSHKNHILHQDLTSENIVLSKDYQAKLTGFGLAQAHTQSIAQARKALRSSKYMAPEVARGDVYTEKADVYSYGIILSEIVGPGSVAYADIIRACCSSDPNARPKMQEVVAQLNAYQFKLAAQTVQQTAADGSSYTSTVLLASYVAQQSQEEKQAMLLFNKAKEAEKTGQHQNAFELYLAAAQLGDTKAQANTGAYLLQGVGGVKIDKIQAHDWLLKAAGKSEPRAQYNLARMLEKGDGIAQNIQQAKHWYEQAARQTQDEKTAEKACTKLQTITNNLALSI